MRRIFLPLMLFAVSPPMLSAEEAIPKNSTEPVVELPDLPAPVESGQEMEPDVTIIRKEKETVEEYRINGHLYMVKVVPRIGPPYYLMDLDGDGTFESRRAEIERGMQTPQWVLFRW